VLATMQSSLLGILVQSPAYASDSGSEIFGMFSPVRKRQTRLVDYPSSSDEYVSPSVIDDDDEVAEEETSKSSERVKLTRDLIPRKQIRATSGTAFNKNNELSAQTSRSEVLKDTCYRRKKIDCSTGIQKKPCPRRVYDFLHDSDSDVNSSNMDTHDCDLSTSNLASPGFRKQVM
jgi:hypothetical protein